MSLTERIRRGTTKATTTTSTPLPPHTIGEDGVATYHRYLQAARTVGNAQHKATVQTNNSLFAKMKG